MGVRSLFAGVSGLRNFQQQLDIIGNNIANSQTAGFKADRVTFADLLSQTSRGATAPGATLGGTNPIQFGLGAQIGAVDTDFNQGNLLTTGRQLDLAISGNGFLKVNDGIENFYTRNGALDIDEAGNLVQTSSGFIVQGFNATAGVLDQTSVTNVNIPVGIVLPAQETSTVNVVGNLDSSLAQVGTILETPQLFADETTAAGTNDVEGLLAYNTATTTGSLISGMQSGITTVTAVDAAANSVTATYVSSGAVTGNDEFSTLEELLTVMNAALVPAISLNPLNNGAVDTAAALTSITSSNAAFGTALAGLATAGLQSFQFAHQITSATSASDLVVDLRNDNGDSLGLANGDVLSANVNVRVDTNPATTAQHTVAAATSTLDDIIATINGLTTTTIGSVISSTNVNNGRLEITGLGGTNYSLLDLDIQSNGAGSTNFNSLFDTTSFSQTQTSTDNHVTSFVAFDEGGTSHTVTVKFNIRPATGGSGQWVFDVESSATTDGSPDSVQAVGQINGSFSGDLTFNSDGSIANVNPPNFEIDPGSSTASNFTVNIDFGTFDGFDGIVQFEAPSSARFANVTGFAAGELQNIAVNSEGLVTGNFTNGQNQTLAQIVLSLFDNPAALEKVGGNNFAPTLNSGVPIDGAPGNGGRGTLIPSALEGSNVDLAAEFVTLITAQRGFQTNARIITTANDILGELVNLVR